MAQFVEHNFPQASPVSFKGSSIDASNVTGTPGSRTAFSHGSSSVTPTSKTLQTPDRGDGSDGKPSIFSPSVHGSGGGFRTTGVPVDMDPFVTPPSTSTSGSNNSGGSNTNGNQPLSATASSFHPFFVGDLPTVESADKKKASPASDKVASEPAKEHGPVVEQVSPSLSTELQLSRCVELSSASQIVTTADTETYLAKLASFGSPCQGHRQIFIKNAKAYVRFTNIRDACVTHRNVHLCGTDWAAKFLMPPEFNQAVAPAESAVGAREGQLDLLAVLLHNSAMDSSQVEPIVFKILRSEGDIFAYRKNPRSDAGTLKAIIEYADINVALHVTSKLNGGMFDGVHLRLDFYQPDGPSTPATFTTQTIDGLMTPMSMSGYQGFVAGPFQKTPQPSQALVPFRHQGTPPASGMSTPQVALVPMVLRNGYTPGTPLILDPYGPHGHNMTPMSGASPMIFQHSAMPHPMMGSHGHHGYDRAPTLASRFANRRGGSSRMDRNHFNQNGHHNQVDTSRIREGVDVRTTIMLRNIPNKVDQRMLKAIVDESSWGKYDFMYLRIDFANDCNVGYAFINFADPLDIIEFAKARDNQRWNCFRSDKVAEISYATIQGRDCLVQKFRNSSVMLEAPHYRPKLYYTLGGISPDLAGQEEEFPGPDNPSKMKRSCENAEHVGLYTPHLSQYYREEQRRRRSQFDRGTRMAALEEYDYETTLQRMYLP